MATSDTIKAYSAIVAPRSSRIHRIASPPMGDLRQTGMPNLSAYPATDTLDGSNSSALSTVRSHDARSAAS